MFEDNRPNQSSGKVDFYTQWKTQQTPQNLRAVVRDLDPVINRSLHQYAKVQTPVVRQRARLMAADAVRSFDPDAGASLSTHVQRQLQRLQRETPNIVDPLPMPERMRRDSATVINAISEAGDVLGSEISDEQVAELTGLPIPRVTKVRRLMRQGISESAYLEGMGEDDEAQDHVVFTSNPYDEWVNAVYHDLSEIDRVIMSYRTGFRGAPTLSNQEIAKRLKMTPGAVTQRANRIQTKLDQFYD